MSAFLGSGFCVLNPEIKIRYLLLLIPNIPATCNEMLITPLCCETKAWSSGIDHFIRLGR